LLAGQAAQVVELRTAHVAAADHLDLLDGRRVYRELALHTDLEADLAHGERLANTLAVAGEHDPLEHLHTRAVALDDVHVNLHGVAWAELGNVALERRGI